MTYMHRRHWSDAERDVLVEWLGGALAERIHPGAVPPDVLRRLPGRSSESVRQYLKRNVVECDEILGSLIGKHMLKSVAPARAATPPCPVLRALEGDQPPEMRPPLPRAMTTNAKRMRLESHSFVSSYLLEMPRSSFEDINKKLGMHRDARTENWDGLSRFM